MSDAPEQGQEQAAQAPRTPARQPRTTPAAQDHLAGDAASATGLPFSAADLDRLERVAPGTTARLIDAYLEERVHQRAVEVRGQRYALIAALAGLAVALIGFIVGALTGHWPASVGGGILGAVDLGALVTAFLTGRPRP